MKASLTALCLFALCPAALGGQAPGPENIADIAISPRDRFYSADQFSNTVSVIDPAAGKLLGVIRLGDGTPANVSPLYRGQLLVHGLGISPDHKTLAVVSIGSNSITFIDTATNKVLRTTYLGRSPHEAFYTPDGSEVWVTVRGENYISVIDAATYQEKQRITVPNGPGMTIFSPDGVYGYVCSSFTPETVAIDVKTHAIAGRIKQDSPFCPNIAATPDGKQVWLTLKDTGKVMVINAKPPFDILTVLSTGPITNHVNFVRNAKGQFAYVTVGGLNSIKVFDTSGFKQIAEIATGALPHGLWPSGDGSRVYVGLENGDAAAVIDTLQNKVVATIPTGQGPQAVLYVPNAVTGGDGTANLQPSASVANVSDVRLNGTGKSTVAIFDQGALQILQAAVTGLEPKKPYRLGLSANADGTGTVEPLAAFMTNSAGAAIVNAIGPLRRIAAVKEGNEKRYLVIASGTAVEPGPIVQVQTQ